MAGQREAREGQRRKNTGKRRRRNRRRRRLVDGILLAAATLAVVFLGFSAVNTAVEALETGGLFPRFSADSQGETDGSAASSITIPKLTGLHSPHAVLAEADSGKILAEYRGSDKIYPASLTKMMTALLAVEHTESLDEPVTLPADIFPPLYAQDASMAGFLPGETVTLRDLLYGILLPSGAECCITYAIRIAGSEEAFVELMNEKAGELGLSHTHFCNSTGLHDENHYSTAEDLAALLSYALKDGDFRAVFTKHRFSTLPSGAHPDGITFSSTLFKDLGSDEVRGGKILGGKTGYTREAGLCLASLAEIEGREYILVTAGAEGNHETEPYHIEDAVQVYNEMG